MLKQIPSSQDGCSDTPEEGGKPQTETKAASVHSTRFPETLQSAAVETMQKKPAALEETRPENKEGYPFPHIQSPARQTKRTLPLRPTVLKPWVSTGLVFVLFCFVFDGEKKRKVGCFFVLLWRSGNKGYRQKTNTSSR